LKRDQGGVSKSLHSPSPGYGHFMDMLSHTINLDAGLSVAEIAIALPSTAQV
jgi:hypothetical protein